VQGGTFLNDAVLRSFETELGRGVKRPTIAGIMGAFGAALAARDLHLARTSLLTPSDLDRFAHTSRPVTCNLCTNHCTLTVNQFDGARRFISGNRCSRPTGKPKAEIPDLYLYKYRKLLTLQARGWNGRAGPHGHSLRSEHVRKSALLVCLFTKLNLKSSSPPNRRAASTCWASKPSRPTRCVIRPS
jgi:hypothetical protein